MQLKCIMLSILPFETQEIIKAYFLLSMFDNYLLILCIYVFQLYIADILIPAIYRFSFGPISFFILLLKTLQH